MFESAGGERAGLARTALGHVLDNRELPENEMFALEAIIIPGERPVVDILDGTFAPPAAPFAELGTAPYRGSIEAAIPSIGRIDVPDSLTLPYAGTGFIVGDGLLMTNRHVAEIFALGLGREDLIFRSGQRAAIDFRRETADQETDYLQIRRVCMIHPYWDMALLEVEGLSPDRIPLTLGITPPEAMLAQTVAVIGYPALDPRNDVGLQNEIFGGRFNVKRMQPGRLQARAELRSYGKPVQTVTHDSSTLGGNSGSAVIDVATGKVVGLHFAGIYLKENYAVPAADMAMDPYIVDAGVRFDGPGRPGPAPWVPYWREADHGSREVQVHAGIGAAGTAPAAGATARTWTIPLRVTVDLGAPQDSPSMPRSAALPPGTTAIEKVPLVDTDYGNRPGYDVDFLGIPVPLPTVSDASVLSRLDSGDTIIPYEHFSLAMHRERRLALFIAGNIDNRQSRKEPEPGRDYSRSGLNGFDRDTSETWLTDPRIPAMHQLPDRFFTKDNRAFDKGHLFRREAAAWGDSYAEVQRANCDTFHVTNCSPQVLGFNRSNRHGIWGKLENRIGSAGDDRLTVFAGPVLAEDDRMFSGVDDRGPVSVQIPSRFWKIVVARNGDLLESFAFLLEQDLADVPLEFQVDAEWRDRMISIADLEEILTDVHFPEVLHAADRFGTA
jgi:endonuclease G